MATQYLRIQATAPPNRDNSKAASVYVDSSDSYKLKYRQNGTVVTIGDSASGQSFAKTYSADPGVATNFLKSAITIDTSMTATSGLNALRGEVNLQSGKTLSGTSYVAGNYGRANIFGTVAIGSGALSAVYAKMDLNGSTLTSGHIAPLQSNIVNPPSDSSKVNLAYFESAGGNVINAYLQCFGKSTYVFDFESNTHNQMSTTGTPGSVTGGTGWLKVLVEGAVRYIPLASSVS